MSVSAEWVAAKFSPATLLVEEALADVDEDPTPGHVGVEVWASGNTDGAILYGTRDEIVAWFHRLGRNLESAGWLDPALEELRTDLAAHIRQEGVPVEVRTDAGSWRDVSSYLDGQA